MKNLLIIAVLVALLSLAIYGNFKELRIAIIKSRPQKLEQLLANTTRNKDQLALYQRIARDTYLNNVNSA